MTADWDAATRGRRAVLPPPAAETTRTAGPAPLPRSLAPVDEPATPAEPKPKRLSWYMRAGDHALMTRLRDELYHAAGAENPALGKQDAEGALARAIAADFATIKHRALADLLGKEPTT